MAFWEAHWRHAQSFEKISKVDSVQHSSSCKLFPESWNPEIKILSFFYDYFIGEQAALNRHLVSRAEAKRTRNKKRREFFFFFKYSTLGRLVRRAARKFGSAG